MPHPPLQRHHHKASVMKTGYYDAAWTTVIATNQPQPGWSRKANWGDTTESLPVGDETVLGCHFTRDTPKQMRAEDASRGPWGDDRDGWSCQDCVRTFSQPHQHVGSNLLRTPCPTVTGVSWQAWCSAPQPALADLPPSESKLREAPMEALDSPSIHGSCVM